MAAAQASIAVPSAGKCAAPMAAEDCLRRKYSSSECWSCRERPWGRMDFPHEVRFSAGIGPAHFLAETTRPLGPRLSAFSPNFYILHLFAKWQWELRRAIKNSQIL